MPDDVLPLSAEELAKEIEKIARFHRPYHAPGGEVGCGSCSSVSSPDVDDGYGWQRWPCERARWGATYRALEAVVSAARRVVEDEQHVIDWGALRISIGHLRAALLRLQRGS